MRDSSNAKKLRGSIGQLIRAYRRRNNLSQENLAEKAEIHRTYISDIELGKVDISISVASRLANALKISLPTLIKKAEEQTL